LKKEKRRDGIARQKPFTLCVRVHLNRKRMTWKWDDLKERKKEGCTCPGPDRSPSPCVRQQCAPEQKVDDLKAGRIERERKRRKGHVQGQTEVLHLLCGSNAHLNRKRAACKQDDLKERE
jgi:hypothetical protein